MCDVQMSALSNSDVMLEEMTQTHQIMIDIVDELRVLNENLERLVNVFAGAKKGKNNV